MRAFLRRRKWKKLLQKTGLFDEAYYFETYPDVRDAKMGAIEHYVKFGAGEGRNPSTGFDTNYYLDRYPDVLNASINPLVHYVLHGRAELRQPCANPLPDPEWRLVFPVHASPLVSIVVPVYNQFDYTYACLRSILLEITDVPYEIIVADDVSTDETREILRYFGHIKVVRHEHNLGFLHNCNRAAKQAAGRYVVFLNNDTRVRPGWLSSMTALMEHDATIGMTGSKLLYPDGRLQEAGGIVWRDASGWNFGRFDDAAKSAYNYVKETDYLSGASIMVRHDLWQEIGGFDERYAPAYYEDTDLAFEIRRRGFRVMYQPKSEVIHFEGITHGTDTSSGMKRHQLLNRETFLAKWKHELHAEHFANAEHVFLARDRTRRRPHVLFVDHYLPHYDQDAGSKAAFQYLKIMQGSGMQVHFIGDNFWHYPDTPYLEALTQQGIEVLYGNWYFEHWQEWIRENGKYFDYAVLSRPHIAVKYIDIVRQCSDAKIIYFGHDLHFLREKRQFEITGDQKHLEESRHWKAKELELIAKSDAGYFFSDAERDVLLAEVPTLNVDVVPLYIYDTFHEGSYAAGSRRDIMFVGGFAHQPNVDAVLWFVDAVWPRIKARFGDMRFFIVGSNPPDAVQALSNDAIVVTGYVSNETLAAYYNDCKMAVAPLRFGAGIKGKVVDALYHGVPLVTTSVGAEGLRDAAGVMEIADTPEAFAQTVSDLYADDMRLAERSRSGVEYCKQYFCEAYAREAMKKTITAFDAPQ